MCVSQDVGRSDPLGRNCALSRHPSTEIAWCGLIHTHYMLHFRIFCPGNIPTMHSNVGVVKSTAVTGVCKGCLASSVPVVRTRRRSVCMLHNVSHRVGVLQCILPQVLFGSELCTVIKQQLCFAHCSPPTHTNATQTHTYTLAYSRRALPRWIEIQIFCALTPMHSPPIQEPQINTSRMTAAWWMW